MRPDALTLMIPSALSLTIAGLFLAGVWYYSRWESALKWWAASHLISGLSVAILVAGIITKYLSLLAIGSVLVTLSPVLIWAGTRQFAGKSIPIPMLVGGLMLWAVLSLLPLGFDRQQVSMFGSFMIWVIYLFAAVGELRNAGEETLTTHRGLMAMFAIHGFIYLLGAIQILMGGFTFGVAPPIDSLFGLIHFETVLYTIGTTMFMLLISKERIDRHYKEAARTDSLTGSLNRGTVCELAQRTLDRCRTQEASFSMILFDLDHFKRINDNHGHLVGDEILRSFADTVRGALRPNDLFGRYGGEEFIVVLAETPVETACFVAERIRTAFAREHRFHNGQPLNATVSAGVTGDRGETQFESVIGLADKALYLAKNGGRNRVERVSEAPPEDGRSQFRIA